MKPQAGRIVLLVFALGAGTASLSAQETSARTATGQPSLADTILTRDVWGMIQILEMAGAPATGCTDAPQLGTRVIAESPKRGDPRKNAWVESWTVRRCDAERQYRVTFTPSRRGTDYAVELAVREPR